MNKKRYIIVILTVLLFVTGCQLAKKEQQTKGKDVLAGILITNSHIGMDDIEDNSDSKIYAKYVKDEKNPESGEYIFEGVDGVYAMAVLRREEQGEITRVLTQNGGIDDLKVRWGDAVTMEGKVYLEEKDVNTFQYHLIYQNEQGEVFALPGEVYRFESNDTEYYEGKNRMSLSFENKSQYVGHEGKKEEVSEKITIDVAVKNPEIKVTLVEMSKDYKEIKRQEYVRDQYPEEIKASKDAAFIVVETVESVGKREKIRREIIEPGENEESDHSAIKTYTLRKDGFYAVEEIPILWP